MKYTINKEHICDVVIYMQIQHKKEIIAEGRTITPDNTKYPFTEIYYVSKPHKHNKIIKVMQDCVLLSLR